MNELDKWWSCLTVVDKERIAGKISGKAVSYPACSVVWNELDDEKRRWIKDHCEKKHGNYIPEWSEGRMFSE